MENIVQKVFIVILIMNMKLAKMEHQHVTETYHKANVILTILDIVIMILIKGLWK